MDIRIGSWVAYSEKFFKITELDGQSTVDKRSLNYLENALKFTTLWRAMIVDDGIRWEISRGKSAFMTNVISENLR